MQIKHYPLLLILPAPTTPAAPNPTGRLSQQQQTTSQTAPPSPVKPTRQQPPQELKFRLKSHDSAGISSTPAASYEETTPTSPKSTDVQTLSKHYQSQQLPSLPPVELAEGARTCIPLESVPESNANIELCGESMFVPYSDKLLVACTRGEDGAAVNGSVSGGAHATKTA
ncbi:hypothetical protein HOY80DRAFT_1034128 [Tuber brumale]|nr:hypothetical protein HOY80DRAFT_1034128 [Tuber brumale]